MRSIMRSRAVTLMLGCALLASCTQAPPASGGFLGATSSDSAFTSAPGGCAYSFLFDNFIIRRAAPVAGAPAPEAMTQARSATLNAPAHVAAANVVISVHGATLSSGGATGQLEIAFGDSSQTFELSAPAGEGEAGGNFEHSFTAPAVSGANTLRVTATLAAAPANEAQIHIDSVDLEIQDAPYCTSAPE